LVSFLEAGETYAWEFTTGAFTSYVVSATIKASGRDSIGICDLYLNYENKLPETGPFYLDDPCYVSESVTFVLQHQFFYYSELSK